MKSRSLVQPQADAILPQSAPIREVQTASHPLLELQAAIGNRAMNQWLAARRKTPDTRQPIQAKAEFQGLARALMDESAQAEELPATLTLGTTTSQGKPMPEAVQEKMEAAFNTDFSDVRIHEGPEAEAIGAIAYTQGSHIRFAPGKYNPISQAGQQVLGHELTHVVQQRNNRVAMPRNVGVPINFDAVLEKEADAAGSRVSQGRLAEVTDVRTTAPTGKAELSSSPIQRMKGIRYYSKLLKNKVKEALINNEVKALEQDDDMGYKERIVREFIVERLKEGGVRGSQEEMNLPEITPESSSLDPEKISEKMNNRQLAALMTVGKVAIGAEKVKEKAKEKKDKFWKR